MEEGSSIIVFSSYCRGIRYIICQTTSCKADVISVLFPLLSLRNLSSICRAPFPIALLFSLSGYTAYWHWYIIIKGIHPYKNGSMFWRSRSLRLKNGAFLPVKYLEIFAMIRLLTSYSNDTRRNEANYWSLSRKIKGQHSCNSLVALSFWQNISTP